MKLSSHNKSLSVFNNKYKGKSVILFATGPSLNKYKPIKELGENIYKCGINGSLFYTLDLDFYFFAVKHLPPQHVNEYFHLINKLPDKTIKIAGVYQDGEHYEKLVSPQEAAAFGAIPVEHSVQTAFFEKDISTYCFYPASIIFKALQFLMYAGFERIYLVGADCSVEKDKHHFYQEPAKWRTKQYKKVMTFKMPTHWKTFKQFQEKEYPQVEIISVNPVGLKGMFKDLFQH